MKTLANTFKFNVKLCYVHTIDLLQSSANQYPRTLDNMQNKYENRKTVVERPSDFIKDSCRKIDDDLRDPQSILCQTETTEDQLATSANISWKRLGLMLKDTKRLHWFAAWAKTWLRGVVETPVVPFERDLWFNQKIYLRFKCSANDIDTKFQKELNKNDLNVYNKGLYTALKINKKFRDHKEDL